jgi:hypothetical protein
MINTVKISSEFEYDGKEVEFVITEMGEQEKTNMGAPGDWAEIVNCHAVFDIPGTRDMDEVGNLRTKFEPLNIGCTVTLLLSDPCEDTRTRRGVIFVNGMFFSLGSYLDETEYANIMEVSLPLMKRER